MWRDGGGGARPACCSRILTVYSVGVWISSSTSRSARPCLAVTRPFVRESRDEPITGA